MSLQKIRLSSKISHLFLQLYPKNYLLFVGSTISHFLFSGIILTAIFATIHATSCLPKVCYKQAIKKPWQNKNSPLMKWRTGFYLFINKRIVFPALIYASIKLGSTKT
jgi:hypothetical protein